LEGERCVVDIFSIILVFISLSHPFFSFLFLLHPFHLGEHFILRWDWYSMGRALCMSGPWEISEPRKKW
jgi:hypothetical protein